MIRRLIGEVAVRGDGFVVLALGGVGLRVSVTERSLRAIPPLGGTATLHTYLHVTENGLGLFGFLSPEELAFFELLIGVSGVGPRSALAIMEVAEMNDLAAAIKEGRPDLLTRASGIGRKTAERIIVDLRSKVAAEKSEAVVKNMESDSDIGEALVQLGYRREQARAAIESLPRDLRGLEARLRAALKILSESR